MNEKSIPPSSYDDLCKLDMIRMYRIIDMCEYGQYGRQAKRLHPAAMVFYNRILEIMLLMTATQAATVRLAARAGLFDEEDGFYPGHAHPDMIESWFDKTLREGHALVMAKLPAEPVDGSNNYVAKSFAEVNWESKYTNAVIRSAVILLHSAFEVFTKDLWARVIELDPPVFAKIYIDNRHRKIDATKLIPAMADSVVAAISDMVSWTNANGIYEAYAAIVPNEPRIEHLLGKSNVAWRTLCEQRDSLIHAGKIVVDDDYNKAAQTNHALGAIIELTPEDVTTAVESIGNAAEELLKLVGEYVVSINPRYADRVDYA